MGRRSSPGRFTERRWVVFLDALKNGHSVRAASARAGLHFTTIYAHVNGDEKLAQQMQHAQHEAEGRLIDAITKSAHSGDTVMAPGGSVTIKPGDWRAAAWLLEHHPQTRERYAAITKQQLGGDPDNPVPIKAVALQVVGDYEMLERNAQIVTMLQRVGALPLPEPGPEVLTEDSHNGHDEDSRG